MVYIIGLHLDVFNKKSNLILALQMYFKHIKRQL